MDIRPYFWNEGIIQINARTKAEALDLLVNTAARHPSVTNADLFKNGILHRERVMSTGIGFGVAIPHAKLASIRDFFISAAVLREGVDWEAVDDESVRLIFLIAGPETQQTRYLQLLARLSVVAKENDRRSALLSARDAKAFIAVFAAN